MNSKNWIRKALSTCLLSATIATSSMITLANSEKITGELLLTGTTSKNETSFVKVNGEAAENGRSIFSSSTIVTPKNNGAVINLGKIGQIELAPDTNLTLSFSEKGIDGNLSSGRVTVLNAAQKVSVKTLDGNTSNLSAGESVATTNGAAQDDSTSDGGSAWIAWAAILGGAAVAIIIAATSDNNRTVVGGGATVVNPVSPTR